MVEGMLWKHESVCSSQTSCTYGLACSKAGERDLQSCCGEFDSHSVHILFRDVIQLAEI
jgi:hypothetical protein